MYKIELYKLSCPRRGLWRKTVKVMRLTILLIIVATMQVSARGYAQKVNLDLKDATLKEAFNHIKQQTGYSFFWNQSLLDKAPHLSIAIKDADIYKALDACLKDLPLTYEIKGKIVYIQAKQPAPDAPATFFTPPPAAHDIRVHVIDSAGAPLQGASVVVKGTKQGGATDKGGNITLGSVADDATIVISFTGYETKEVTVDSRESIAVVLTMKVNALEDIVVNKGYYTTTKALNTGDVSTVTAAEIGRQPVGDPLAALIGRVPGLQVTQNRGLPGKAFTVQLRGRNSIANGNIPLYIIDGVPFYNDQTSVDNDVFYIATGTVSSPLNSINPSDIESISVLKDADATAIYGSRGANGVILVTTKKGRTGKTKFDFNAYSGLGHVTRMMPMMNTQQYLEMRREAFKNDGVTSYPTNAYDINGTWDTTRYTDWQKVLIGNTSHYSDAQASMSGGNAQTQFLIGVGYHKETTIYPGDFADKRGSAHINLSHRSTDKKFSANLSAFYSEDNNMLPLNDFATNNLNLPPDAPAIYDSAGNLNWQNSTWTNPFQNLYASSNTIQEYLNSNLLLSYDITNELQIKTNLGFTKTNYSQANLTPSTFYNPAQTSTQAQSVFASNHLKSWTIEPQLNYKKQWGEGRLDALVGMSFFQQEQDGSVYLGAGYSSDALLYNLLAANTVQVGSITYSLYRFVSLLGRINYSWEDKYVLNLTARRDGSTRFGPGKQYGNFGSVGAAWIFSREKWMEDAFPFLNFGKFRASYGITGSDQIGNYSYLDTYTPYSAYQGYSTLTPVRFLNPDYAWEINKKLEAGLELGFLKDGIHFTMSWYSNLSGNQLLNYSLPVMTGFGVVLRNLPAKVRNSGLEFTLNSQNIQSKTFDWTTNINLTVPIDDAKLIAYPDLANSSYASYYAINKSMSISKTKHYLGVDPETGLYTFEDYDNNEIINSDDNRSIIFTGQQFYGGIENNFSYKRFQLSIFFQFVKRKFASNYLSILSSELPGTMQNQPIWALTRWQQEGDVSDVQKFSNSNSLANTANTNLLGSDGIYGDASYIRLKNFSLAYQFSGLGKKKNALQNLRIYIQAQNLLTITPYRGLDPENAGLTVPPLRVLTAGLEIVL